jgi:hypothetical protein
MSIVYPIERLSPTLRRLGAEVGDFVVDHGESPYRFMLSRALPEDLSIVELADGDLRTFGHPDDDGDEDSVPSAARNCFQLLK